MFCADHLSFHYEKSRNVLSDISLIAEPGKILGILGHNGSGKSTLFKILSGLIPPSEGNVTIDEKNLNSISVRDLYRRIGCLIEDPAFYNHLSVSDNLKILASYRGITFRKIDKVLARVGAEYYQHQKTKSLSTGMRQRVGLAAVLLQDPEIILLDEPGNGLDPEGLIQVREILTNLKKEGKTLLVSSHILSEMEKISDELIILREGKVIFNESVEAIKKYRDLEELYVSLTLQKAD